MPRSPLIVILTLCLLSLTAVAQTTIHLPSTTATLIHFAPTDTTNCHNAVIICPGGSYCWLGYRGEGTAVAHWLNANGIDAYVLKYRTLGWWAWATRSRLLYGNYNYDHPLHDVIAAISYVDSALQRSTPHRRLGIMGFSAGGHLAMLAATADTTLSWAAAIYPVITMTSPYAHSRSRRALLSERHQADTALQRQLSIEHRISPSTPPTFAVACIDDHVVDHHNTLLLDSALTANAIPHLTLIYNTGGHGFGLKPNKGTAECRQWTDKFLQWLNLMQ